MNISSEKIHHINSGLIILSCLIAIYVPFELFLFSYSILGPLHYLTEIGWLHQKGYFTKNKNDYWVLVLACLIFFYWNYFPPKNTTLISDLLFFSLITSVSLVWVKKWFHRIVLGSLMLLATAFLNNSVHFYIWIGVFLPTVIHVFVFTGAFMLFGALKEKSVPGLISIALLIICSLLLFTMSAIHPETPISPTLQKIYMPFHAINFRLIQYFQLEEIRLVKDIFTTSAGFTVMRFIAFAYTYHYLNWFSKTTVIKWHLVPKKHLLTILALWIISCMLYWCDYLIGFNVLLLLSFLHVFLEFPLNVYSFVGIGKEFLALLRQK